MKSKKILVIFPHLGMGGVEKSLEFVSNTYSESGNNVYVLSLSKDKKKHVKLNDNISIDYLQYPKYLLKKILFMIFLRRKIKQISPDLIIAFRTDVSRIISFAVIGLDIKILSSERGDPERYNLKQKKKYEKALSKCSKVVFQTEFAKSFFNKDVQSIGVIIPNPCPIHSNTSLYNVNNNIILSYGRMSAEKNFAGLIKAFSIICDKVPDYELHIYGDGPEREQLEELIKSLNNSKIKLFPTVDNVFFYEKNVALFVLNSVSEGMPNALIEAMAIGIPCISTDCPGGVMEHLADGGRRLLLVPRNEPLKLANKMLEVLKDSDKANNLAQNAIEIRQTLSSERIKKMWLSLLEEIFK